MTERERSRGSGDERLQAERTALVNMVLGDMARDGADWSKAWSFDTPRNPSTGTVYHGRNAMLLYLCMRVRGIEDPRFLTFKQAKEMGLAIRKGAKSFAIEHWSKVWTKVDPDTGKRVRVRPPRDAAERAAYEADASIRQAGPFCNGHWNVFSATDLEGIEPYAPTSGLVGPNELVDFLEGASPCPVTETYGDEAYYSRLSDSITIPARSQFESEESLARVLLHEQAHATGSPDRLAREKGERFGDDRYAFEELVAELSSMMSANELGVSIPSVGRDSEFARSAYWDRHVAYIKSWSSSFPAEEATDLVLQAASKAGQATSWLMDRCFSPALRRREAERGNEPLSLTLARASSHAAPGRPEPERGLRVER